MLLPSIFSKLSDLRAESPVPKWLPRSICNSRLTVRHDTVDTVDNVDTVDTVDNVDIVDIIDPIDCIYLEDLGGGCRTALCTRNF